MTSVVRAPPGGRVLGTLPNVLARGGEKRSRAPRRPPWSAPTCDPDCGPRAAQHRPDEGLLRGRAATARAREHGVGPLCG